MKKVVFFWLVIQDQIIKKVLLFFSQLFKFFILTRLLSIITKLPSSSNMALEIKN